MDPAGGGRGDAFASGCRIFRRPRKEFCGGVGASPPANAEPDDRTDAAERGFCDSEWPWYGGNLVRRRGSEAAQRQGIRESAARGAADRIQSASRARRKNL